MMQCSVYADRRSKIEGKAGVRRKQALGFGLLFSMSLLACEFGPDDGESSGTPLGIALTEAMRERQTLSLRSGIDVPGQGQVLDSASFREQLSRQDPLQARRCPISNSQAFDVAVETLGGITWTHPVRVLKDESLPPLYDGVFPMEPPPPTDHERFDVPTAEGGSDSAEPTIEAPDLIGLAENIAVFLSQKHGLLAVDVTQEEPRISCALKLPGHAKNFFYRDGDIIILSAARAQDNAALLRFGVADGSFAFKEAKIFEHQRILDARRFYENENDTLLIYTQWYDAPEEVQPGNDCEGEQDDCEDSSEQQALKASPDRSASGMAPADEGLDIAFGRPRSPLGTKLHSIRWAESFEVQFEDSYVNDTHEDDPHWVMDVSQFQEGDLIRESATQLPFMAASARYAVIAERLNQTYHAGFETRSWSVCTDWNPQHHQVQRCHGVYEQRDNPDYQEPDLSGDYDCNGQKLADCIQEAAPRVSRYIRVRVGQVCEDVWMGACEASEIRSATYPVYDHETKTRYVIYRYDQGEFLRLDSVLYELEQTGGSQDPHNDDTVLEDVDTLTFAEAALVIDGTIGSRDHIQFQNGHLYVLSNGILHTMKVAGNSLIRTHRRSIFYGNHNHTLARFTPDRLLLSQRIDYGRGSHIISVDLSTPFAPRVNNQYAMPGRNSSLVLSAHGFLGSGTVSFSHGNVRRNLQKLTLHAPSDGAEQDNLLLGTEFDSIGSSWYYGEQEGQRLHWGTQRLLTPFQGTHHVDHRRSHFLNISQVNPGDLQTEGTIEMPEHIVRTVNIDDDEVLAFGQSSLNCLRHNNGSWSNETIEEIYVPIAGYRFAEDGYLKIEAFSNNCIASTHQNVTALFEQDAIETYAFRCGSTFRAVGRALIVDSYDEERRFGFQWDEDGGQFTALTETEIDALLAMTQHDIYCTTDPTNRVEYYPNRISRLDTVPVQMTCGPFPDWIRQ